MARGDYLSKPRVDSNSAPHSMQKFEISGDSLPHSGQILTILSPYF